MLFLLLMLIGCSSSGGSGAIKEGARLESTVLEKLEADTINWSEVLPLLNSENINHVDDFNRTLLHLCIKDYNNHQNIENVKSLIAKGADIRAKDKLGRIPLFYINNKLNSRDIFKEIYGKLSNDEKMMLYNLKDVYKRPVFFDLYDNDLLTEIFTTLTFKEKFQLLSLSYNDGNYTETGINLLFARNIDFDDIILEGLTTEEKIKILSLEVKGNTVLNSIYLSAEEPSSAYIQIFNKLFEGLSDEQKFAVKKVRGRYGRTALFNFNEQKITALFDGLTTEQKEEYKAMKDDFGLTAYDFIVSVFLGDASALIDLLKPAS